MAMADRSRIGAQKAAMVRVEDEPLPLAERMAQLADLWEKRARQPGMADDASALEWCAAELREELER
jgi:hypothetical protein